MTLRRKVLLIIGLGLGLSIFAIFVSTHSFLLQNSRKQEQAAVILDIKRAELAVAGRLNELARIGGDYAHWDDTYRFIDDRNEKYIRNNIIGSTFANLRVNLFIFLDRGGRLVLAQAFDLNQEQQLPPPVELLAQLKPGNPLLAFSDPASSNKGIINTAAGPMLIIAVPILTSELKGPANGTLLIGRYLDKALIKQFSEQIQVNLVLSPPNPALLERLQQEKYLITPLDAERVGGFALLPDIYGKPAVLLEVVAPRDIYRQGQQTIITFAVMILVIGLLVVIFALFILERIILAPLATLSSEVVRISRRGNPAARLKAAGRDELAVLAQQINQALDALTVAEQKKSESEKKFEKLFSSLPEAIYLEQLDGTIIDCNPAACQMTGYAREELLELKSYDLVPPEVARIFPRLVEQTLSAGGFSLEGVNKRKDGTLFPVEVSTKPLDLSGAKLLIVVVREITEQKRTAEKLQTQIKELEEFQNAVVGRELKMIELEKEIDALRAELGRPPKYQ
jgi:PAS domain S-box-containing protein